MFGSLYMNSVAPIKLKIVSLNTVTENYTTIVHFRMYLQLFVSMEYARCQGSTGGNAGKCLAYIKSQFTIFRFRQDQLVMTLTMDGTCAAGGSGATGNDDGGG